MKKKFIPLILVLLTGCGLGHIEDTNGDDTRVATISDEKILGVSSHSSFMMISNSIQKKGVTTGSVKSSKFSGVKKIESFNKTNKNTVESQDYLCTIKSYYSDYNLQSIYLQYKDLAVENFYKKFCIQYFPQYI